MIIIELHQCVNRFVRAIIRVASDMHYHHVCATRQQLEAYETAISKIICVVVHIALAVHPVKCVGVQPAAGAVHRLYLREDV